MQCGRFGLHCFNLLSQLMQRWPAAEQGGMGAEIAGGALHLNRVLFENDSSCELGWAVQVPI